MACSVGLDADSAEELVLEFDEALPFDVYDILTSAISFMSEDIELPSDGLSVTVRALMQEGGYPRDISGEITATPELYEVMLNTYGTEYKDVFVRVQLTGRWREAFPDDGGDTPTDDPSSGGGITEEQLVKTLEEYVKKEHFDEVVGDIESALDELHTYAQALINGGGA